MKKNERITWLDTYCEGGYSYEDFVEYCKDQNWDMQEDELEIPAEYSASYWEWVREQIEDDVECFFENLKYTKGIVNEPCVISGTLGLWWGGPAIEEVMCDSLAEAVKKCWSGCDDVQVTSKDGVVYVVAMHHDGRNCFEIRPLTERGREKMRDGEDICVGNHWHTGKYPKYLY